MYFTFFFLIWFYFYSKPVASFQAMNRGMGTMIQLDIILNNESSTIYGFGQNKKEAKVAAAKMALKQIKKEFSWSLKKSTNFLILCILMYIYAFIVFYSLFI